MAVDEIYTASAEVLIAAARLGSERDLPSIDQLRAEIMGMLQTMVSRCRATGVPDADTAEARYALVAFIDERILKSTWVGRSEWMNNPLQLQLFREFTAGENFFVRMKALLQREVTPPSLEIYYLCLALGFTGASSASDNLLQPYVQAARQRLPRGERAISPHALPRDHFSFTRPRPPLVTAIVLGCVAVVVFALGLFHWSLNGALDRARRDIQLLSRDGASTDTERAAPSREK